MRTFCFHPHPFVFSTILRSVKTPSVGVLLCNSRIFISRLRSIYSESSTFLVPTNYVWNMAVLRAQTHLFFSNQNYFYISRKMNFLIVRRMRRSPFKNRPFFLLVWAEPACTRILSPKLLGTAPPLIFSSIHLHLLSIRFLALLCFFAGPLGRFPASLK